MAMWGWGSDNLLERLQRRFERGCRAPQLKPALDASPRCTKTPEPVYGNDRNGCTETSGARTKRAEGSCAATMELVSAEIVAGLAPQCKHPGDLTDMTQDRSSLLGPR